LGCGFVQEGGELLEQGGDGPLGSLQFLEFLTISVGKTGQVRMLLSKGGGALVNLRLPSA
jgi:hypothetical protein